MGPSKSMLRDDMASFPRDVRRSNLLGVGGVLNSLVLYVMLVSRHRESSYAFEISKNVRVF